VGGGGKSEFLRTTASQLDRSDDGRSLLGSWSNRVLERSRVAVKYAGQHWGEKPARNREIRVETGVAASHKWDIRGKILDVVKNSNSPDYSVRVVDLGLDHISKAIDIFLDVEHRQRHGTREPYRR